MARLSKFVKKLKKQYNTFKANIENFRFSHSLLSFFLQGFLSEFLVPWQRFDKKKLLE